MALLAYSENPLTPGRIYFDCDRLKAKLCVDTCSGMWRSANLEGHPEREACKRCPIGAEHAGELFASTSHLAGTLTCARCHTPAGRLIGRMHCVSCKNREYEFVKGRNAKGSPPVKLACLARRSVRYVAGGKPCSLTLSRALDQDELIVATLRDSKHTVRFGFGVSLPPTIPQLRLF